MRRPGDLHELDQESFAEGSTDKTEPDRFVDRLIVSQRDGNDRPPRHILKLVRDRVY